MIELNLEKIQERKALVDMSKRSNGLKGVQMKVKLALDKSGSMSQTFKNGKIQELLERIVPVAMSLDDDGEFDLYLFDDSVEKSKKTVNLQNVAGFVNRELSNLRMGGTCYTPVINKIVGDEYGFTTKQVQKTKETTTGGFLGFGSKTQIENYTVTENVLNTNITSIPSFVIFITDGSNGDPSETQKALIEASKVGTFFCFIGIGDNGCTNFPMLEKLDDMTGRIVDNANFFSVQNLSSIDDRDLYLKLLEEVSDWIKDCKTKLILS